MALKTINHNLEKDLKSAWDLTIIYNIDQIYIRNLHK